MEDGKGDSQTATWRIKIDYWDNCWETALVIREARPESTGTRVNPSSAMKKEKGFWLINGPQGPISRPTAHKDRSPFEAHELNQIKIAFDGTCKYALQ